MKVLCVLFLTFSLYSSVVYARIVIDDDLPVISDNSVVLKGEPQLKNTTENVKEDKTEDKCLNFNAINSTADRTTKEDLECLLKLLNAGVLNITSLKPDNGVALILTPFIEEGHVEEARNASKVDPAQILGLESYSGYLTVNKTYDSNLFFWYFPVENKSVTEMPWIIWLQGGPGASSLTGLFDEIGPITFKDGKLIRNPYSWLQNHSLVFIDNPVGTGFSFTNHPDGYANDSTTYATHLYTAFKQLVQIFPELKAAPLFVAGESYAGKYVPGLAAEIHKHMADPDGAVKMEGMMIGNAYVEPSMIADVNMPFLHFGLLSKEQLDMVQPLVDAFHNEIAANRSIEAKKKFSELISILLVLSHQKHAYNYLKDDIFPGHFISFLDRSLVRKAIHVGDMGFNFINMTVNSMLAPDFLSNARPKFEMLLDHYRVFTYCGQLDQMLPCAYTSESYRKWRWGRSQEFANATRYPFIYKGKLAGYLKTGGGLTEAVIRGAGHLAPMDQPAPTQELVTKWTHQQQIKSDSTGYFEESFIRSYIKNYTSDIYL